MGGLALGATLLQNGQRMQENLRLLTDHIHYHEDHLLFLVGDLVEAEGGQVQFVVDLEDVFKRGQSVHYVPVINLRMLIDLHSRCAAAHFYFDFSLYLN